MIYEERFFFTFWQNYIINNFFLRGRRGSTWGEGEYVINRIFLYSCQKIFLYYYSFENDNNNDDDLFKKCMDLSAYMNKRYHDLNASLFGIAFNAKKKKVLFCLHVFSFLSPAPFRESNR
mgnify:CR=1 FL=1